MTRAAHADAHAESEPAAVFTTMAAGGGLPQLYTLARASQQITVAHIAGGTGTLPAADVAPRTARVVEAAGALAPARTTAPTPPPAPVVAPRPAG